jgi:hypothetical protein
MSASAATNVEIARRLVAALEAAAPAARTRADTGGGAGALAGLLGKVAARTPGSGALFEVPARREVATIDPGLGRALERWFRAPLEEEARARTAVAAAIAVRPGASERLSEAMHAYRAPDLALRGAARMGIEAALDRVRSELRVEIERLRARREPGVGAGAPPAAAAQPKPAPARGAIVAPSRELIESLAAGQSFDPELARSLFAGGEAAGEPAGSAPLDFGGPLMGGPDAGGPRAPGVAGVAGARMRARPMKARTARTASP